MFTTRKRILIFSLAYYPLVGGAEIAVKEITDRLQDFQFDMVTLRFNKSHPEREVIGNVNVYRINGSKNMFPFRAFIFAWRLHRKRTYTHVWSIMANWAGFAALFFKHYFPDVKYILTLQEGDPIEYIKRRVRFIYPLFKRIFLRADIIQVISNYLGDWARSMGYVGPLIVIPNGVNFDKFGGPSTSSTSETMLVTTSRLVEKNGIADIIDSLKFLPDNIKLTIIGSGPLVSNLNKKVKENKLQSRVKFLGFIDQKEIPQHLHAAHIFIRQSVSEGMGNSFIEAMAAGLPVIATPVGGIVDFLFDPDKNRDKPPTGLFVNVHDPEGIAKQVKRLLKNENLRHTLIANGKRLVRDHYDWDLIAKEMRSRVFNSP